MLEALLESLYTCFGGLGESVLQPIIPWSLSEKVYLGLRQLVIIKQVRSRHLKNCYNNEVGRNSHKAIHCRLGREAILLCTMFVTQ